MTPEPRVDVEASFTDVLLARWTFEADLHAL